MTKVSGDRSKLPLTLRRRESAQKAAASAEAEKEKAFANMEEASDKQELVDTEEYKYFRDCLLPGGKGESSAGSCGPAERVLIFWLLPYRYP